MEIALLFIVLLFIGLVVSLFVATLQSAVIDEYKEEGLVKESEVTEDKVKGMWGFTPVTSAIVEKMVQKNKQKKISNRVRS